MTSVGRDRGRAEFGALLQQFLERKIQLRAYEMYEQRGRADGRALDDWLQAEDEILGQSISTPFYQRRRPHAHSPLTGGTGWGYSFRSKIQDSAMADLTQSELQAICRVLAHFLRYLGPDIAAGNQAAGVVCPAKSG
jgi:hypothetical protein